MVFFFFFSIFSICLRFLLLRVHRMDRHEHVSCDKVKFYLIKKYIIVFSYQGKTSTSFKTKLFIQVLHQQGMTNEKQFCGAIFRKSFIYKWMGFYWSVEGIVHKGTGHKGEGSCVTFHLRPNRGIKQLSVNVTAM